MNIYGFWNALDRRMKVWLLIGYKIHRRGRGYIGMECPWVFVISSDPALARSLKNGGGHRAIVLGNFVIGFVV